MSNVTVANGGDPGSFYANSSGIKSFSAAQAAGMGEYFGVPAYEIDPKSERRFYGNDLQTAYSNRETIVTNTIIKGISKKLSWYSLLCPLKQTDRNSTFTSIHYPEFIANFVSEGAPYQVVASKKTSRTLTMRRIKMGLQMGADYLPTPEGKVAWNNHLGQVINGIFNFMGMRAAHAVLEADDYHTVQMRIKGVEVSSAINAIKFQIDEFGYLQIYPNALPQLIIKIKERMNKAGVLPDYAVVSENVLTPLALNNGDLEVFRMGETEVRGRLANGGKAYQNVGGLTVLTNQPIAAENLAEAEFDALDHYLTTGEVNFIEGKPIKIYDLGLNRWVLITPEAILKGNFDRRWRSDGSLDRDQHLKMIKKIDEISKGLQLNNGPGPYADPFLVYDQRTKTYAPLDFFGEADEYFLTDDKIEDIVRNLKDHLYASVKRDLVDDFVALGELADQLANPSKLEDDVLQNWLAFISFGNFQKDKPELKGNQWGVPELPVFDNTLNLLTIKRGTVSYIGVVKKEQTPDASIFRNYIFVPNTSERMLPGSAVANAAAIEEFGNDWDYDLGGGVLDLKIKRISEQPQAPYGYSTYNGLTYVATLDKTKYASWSSVIDIASRGIKANDRIFGLLTQKIPQSITQDLSYLPSFLKTDSDIQNKKALHFSATSRFAGLPSLISVGKLLPAVGGGHPATPYGLVASVNRDADLGATVIGPGAAESRATKTSMAINVETSTGHNHDDYFPGTAAERAFRGEPADADALNGSIKSLVNAPGFPDRIRIALSTNKAEYEKMNAFFYKGLDATKFIDILGNVGDTAAAPIFLIRLLHYIEAKAGIVDKVSGGNTIEAKRVKNSLVQFLLNQAESGVQFDKMLKNTDLKDLANMSVLGGSSADDVAFLRPVFQPTAAAAVPNVIPRPANVILVNSKLVFDFAAYQAVLDKSGVMELEGLVITPADPSNPHQPLLGNIHLNDDADEKTAQKKATKNILANFSKAHRNLSNESAVSRTFGSYGRKWFETEESKAERALYGTELTKAGSFVKHVSLPTGIESRVAFRTVRTDSKDPKLSERVELTRRLKKYSIPGDVIGTMLYTMVLLMSPHRDNLLPFAKAGLPFAYDRYLLYRPWIVTRNSSMLVFKSGPSTGVTAWNWSRADLALNDLADEWRGAIMTWSESLIVEPMNIFNAFGVFIKSYEGGRGTNFIDSVSKFDVKKPEDVEGDIFVACVGGALTMSQIPEFLSIKSTIDHEDLPLRVSNAAVIFKGLQMPNLYMIHYFNLHMLNSSNKPRVYNKYIERINNDRANQYCLLGPQFVVDTKTGKEEFILGNSHWSKLHEDPSTNVGRICDGNIARQALMIHATVSNKG